MMRHGTYTIKDVLSHVQFTSKRGGKSSKVKFGRELVNMASDRYKLFATKGCKCVSCGIEGKFFALEKNEIDIGYHFNLYAMKNDKEVLMTKDHIVPKAVGGRDIISNYQPMCVTCNGDKRHGPPGLTLEEWQDVPLSSLKVGAIQLILADWKLDKDAMWEEINSRESELQCSTMIE